MDAEWVVSLLEDDWNRLQVELGDHWNDFALSYGNIVAGLQSGPGREEIEHAADEICKLLGRYEYGRGLLRGYQALSRERMLPSPSEELSEEERLQQVCNRMIELPERKQQENQKQEEDR